MLALVAAAVMACVGASVASAATPTLTLTAPANAAYTNHTQPTLSWTLTGATAAKYEIFITGPSTPGVSTPQTTVTTTATSFTPSAPLADGFYDWTVNAFSSSGSVITSAGSEFTVDTEAPAPPKLFSPTNGSTVLNQVQVLEFGPGTVTGTVTGSPVTGARLSIDGGPLITLPNNCFDVGLVAGLSFAQCTVPDALGVGVHTWTVEAVDEAGNVSAPATASFTIKPSSPFAFITQPKTAVVGQPVTFSAARSQDTGADGPIVDYAWDFDGSKTYTQNTGDTPTVSHVFTTPGIHEIDLRVTDAGGQTATSRTLKTFVGLTPPKGQVGVSIDDDAYATNNPHVHVDLVWPRRATSATLSNDGGFKHTKTVPLTPSVGWTLEQTGSDRLPKTVYVRFHTADSSNGSGPVTLSDDIVLDEQRPVLSLARVVGSRPVGGAAEDAKRKFNVKLDAGDKIVGICGAEAVDARSARTRGHVKSIRDCHKRGVLKFAGMISVVSHKAPHWVRVLNAAGTWSRWHHL